MYLFEDDLFFEFFDDQLIVTNIFNKTLPLIRYKMSDVLSPIVDKNNFYPFTKVSNFVGRQEFAPVFTNEIGEDDFIHPIIL